MSEDQVVVTEETMPQILTIRGKVDGDEDDERGI